MESENNSLAVNILKERKSILACKKRGLPSVGCNPNHKEFSHSVEPINKAFKIYGNKIFELEDEYNKDIPKNSLGGGSPLNFKPYKPCLKMIKKSLKQDDYSDYPLAMGDDKYKKIIIKYLINEGFCSHREILNDNLIFTVSSTHAFNLIIDTISKPKDVIIMTGPNYGLFAFVPERLGVDVEILNLKKENNFLPDPKELNFLIKKINKRLYEKADDKNNPPRVVGFLNMNPHNPLGTVIDGNKRDLLFELCRVCKENGVFLIDDLIYRDIVFPGNQKAIYAASCKGMFDNVITMFGLSKCYGFAALRTGVVVANECVIRGIRNRLFQTMDSPPTLQAAALAGAFNYTKLNRKYYLKYFKKLNSIYFTKYLLLKVLVEGIESIDEEYQDRIRERIKSGCKKANIKIDMLDGIQKVSLFEDLEPTAGFFCILNFTKLLGKKYGNFKIKDDVSLLKYLYKYGKIKFIIGKSMAWPNKKEIVGRVTFALSDEDLITAFYYLKKCIQRLK